MIGAREEEDIETLKSSGFGDNKFGVLDNNSPD